MFSVYLDPDPKVTEEQRAKAIFSRGGLTKEEAKRRAKKATELIEKSKKMQFDLRVTMMKGKYDEGAKKILSELPLMNPPIVFDEDGKPHMLPSEEAMDMEKVMGVLSQEEIEKRIDAMEAEVENLKERIREPPVPPLPPPPKLQDDDDDGRILKVREVKRCQ